MKSWRYVLLAFVLSLSNAVHAQTLLPTETKGMWIWKLWSAESGNLNTVIAKLKSVDASWVVIKMADSDSYYNSVGRSLYSWAANYGGMDSVVVVFHNNGIKLLGYQYVYGEAQYGLGPSESDVANMILSVNGIDGLLIDAEIEFDTLSARVATAEAYMDTIRAHHLDSFVGLASWARVTGHSTFPWVQFLDQSDANLPQTYWAARSITPAIELSRMNSDFSSYTQTWVDQGDSAAAKPIMPIGQAEYFGYGSNVVAGDISNFCSLSQTTYKYKGVSLWEYAQITSSFVWDEYSAAWPLESVAEETGIPVTFDLSQNYPNPFNPSTTIDYSLPAASRVRLVIFNLLGEKVATLRDDVESPGHRSATWNANAASGLYFYRLEATPIGRHASAFSSLRKMILLK